MADDPNGAFIWAVNMRVASARLYTEGLRDSVLLLTSPLTHCRVRVVGEIESLNANPLISISKKRNLYF